jgi:hypothetical protein
MLLRRRPQQVSHVDAAAVADEGEGWREGWEEGRGGREGVLRVGHACRCYSRGGRGGGLEGGREREGSKIVQFWHFDSRGKERGREGGKQERKGGKAAI